MNTLEGILPMDQINKPILNSPIWPLPVYILDFVVLSLLSVIRLMNIFCL